MRCARNRASGWVRNGVSLDVTGSSAISARLLDTLGARGDDDGASWRGALPTAPAELVLLMPAMEVIRFPCLDPAHGRFLDWCVARSMPMVAPSQHFVNHSAQPAFS